MTDQPRVRQDTETAIASEASGEALRRRRNLERLNELREALRAHSPAALREERFGARADLHD